MLSQNNNKTKEKNKMEFIKKNKTSLITGASCFFIGYIAGGIMETRSLHQQLSQNIFNQVVGQQSKMRESREASQRRFKSIPRLGAKMKAKVVLPEVGVEGVDLPGKYYVAMKVKAIANPTAENIDVVKGMNARLIKGNDPYHDWALTRQEKKSPAKKEGS